MPGISDNNVALAVVNGDDDEEKVNLIRMVTMRRKKKNLIRMVCRAPGQSSLCIYCPGKNTQRVRSMYRLHTLFPKIDSRPLPGQ